MATLRTPEGGVSEIDPAAVTCSSLSCDGKELKIRLKANKLVEEASIDFQVDGVVARACVSVIALLSHSLRLA